MSAPIYYVDPMNPSSYSGSGSSMTNLGSASITSQLVGYSYNSANLGMQITGATGYLQLGSVTNARTITMWYKYASSQVNPQSYILDARNGGSGGYILKTEAIGPLWVNTTYISDSSGNITTYAPINSSQYGLFYAMPNAWMFVTVTATSNFTDDITFFNRVTLNEGSSVIFGPIKIYNRVLSSLEVQADFYAFASRYGYYAPPTPPQYPNQLLRVNIPLVRKGAMTPIGNQTTFRGFGGGKINQFAAAAPSGGGGGGGTSGSIIFSGSSISNLSIAANQADFQFGTGDFTIEWFQFMSSSGNGTSPRMFAVGTYPNEMIGFSFEIGVNQVGVWVGNSGGLVLSASLVSSTLYSKWVHFAISRSGTSLRLFLNGSQIGSTATNSTNIVNTTDVFRIANESDTAAYTTTAYCGSISNFRVVKGSALYTSNFTVPTSTLTAVAGTVLLLTASSLATKVADTSGTGKVVTDSSTTWSGENPFA
jgi:hypothetical protein